MNSLILTMAGGAIGSGTRYLAGGAITRVVGTGWPWGTLSVNVIGDFLMGMLAGRVADGGDPVRLFLGVGFLGGFTTFSAFSLESVEMIQRGSPLAALGYAVASVTLCVTAVFCGMILTR